VNCPALEKVCVGFWAVEILAGPELGSPKFQFHPLIAPEETVEASVKPVGYPKQTGVEVKEATGRGFTIATKGSVSVHPDEFETIRVTVNVPGVP
jgi:hypothetical protein